MTNAQLRKQQNHPSEDPLMVSTQVELEMLYSKNQTIPRIKKEFRDCDTINFVAHMEQHQIPIEFGLDVLTQMALHKRAHLSTMIGILRWHFGADSATASQITADMLLKCALADLIDWDPITSQFIVIYTMTADVQEDLDRFQYPLPMVVEPCLVRKNTDTGYMLGGGSLILRQNHTNDDICLDHINRVNRIRFAIDHDTVAMVQNEWRNLDKPKEGETKDDFDRRKRAFEKYDRTVRDVIAALSLYSEDIYLTHKYDKRGRTYCQGYHINYQGAPWNKATVELADKEMVL